MKKFHFSLGRMLDYKEQLLDKEKNTLAQLRAHKQRLEDKIDRLTAEANALGETARAESRAGITAVKLHGYEFQISNIREQIKALRVEFKTMEALVENQLKVVLAATQEVSGLEKLKEKQLEEYNYAQTKAEELVISEFISSQLVRNKNAMENG